MSLFIQMIYLAAGLSILYIFVLYRSNPFRRLPATTVTVVFTLGMIAVIPVVVINRLLPLEDGGILFNAFVRAGLIEEGVKFLIIAITIWRFKFPDLAEPIDLVIYCGILGVGFGIYEDFWFLFGGTYPAWTGDDIGQFHRALRMLIFARAFPGHIIINALAGFLLGHARFLARPRDRALWIIGGFLFAVLLHGLFNVIAITGGAIPLLTYVTFLIGIFLHLRRRMLERSPFRALIELITAGKGEWPYPRPPVDYLFAEGFAWPGRVKGGMFQVFPLVLSLFILYPVLVMGVYLAQRVGLWLVGG